MRNLRKNKQVMFVASPNGSQQVYATDYEGNVKYEEIDGDLVPIELGTVEVTYGEPQRIVAVISSELRNQVYFRAWGVDMANIYSVIITKKGEYDLEIGSIVWRENEVVYNPDGTPKASSSEYTIKNYMKESLFGDFWLLQRNNSEVE